MWYVQVKYECLSTKTEPDDDGQTVTGVPYPWSLFGKKDSSGLLCSLSKKIPAATQ